jgi:CarD family transcriptional regulator
MKASPASASPSQAGKAQPGAVAKAKPNLPAKSAAPPAARPPQKLARTAEPPKPKPADAPAKAKAADLPAPAARRAGGTAETRTDLPSPPAAPGPAPKAADTKATPPKMIETGAPAPKTIEPRTVEPKAVEPKTAEPKAAEAPRAPQPPLQNGRPVPPSRAAAKEENFAEGDYVVYPTHGVGKVERIVREDIAGHSLELIHITFEENRMTLRVPVTKARTAGLRKLATRKMFDEALAVLKGRARIKRTMWSRRAQEYEAKINSGDPIAIAEVVRDLHRNAGQPDQSFSERQIYEAAMDRLAAELAALDQTDKPTAITKLVNFLKTV